LAAAARTAAFVASLILGWSASAIDAALRETPTASATSRRVTVDRDGGKLVDGMRRPDLVDGADGHRMVPVRGYGSVLWQRLGVDLAAPPSGRPMPRSVTSVMVASAWTARRARPAPVADSTG
jgi:hypothetical protein